MRSRLIKLAATGFLLLACSLTTSPAPNENASATELSQQVATELSQRLTEAPPRRSATPAGTQPLLPTPSLQAPSETPQPTDPPTETTSPTDTPAPEDPAQSLGPPSWQDNFNDAANWYLYEDDHTRINLIDGSLQLTALNPEGWSGWALSWPVLSDFYLEALMSPGACSGLDRYGLVFRSPDSDQAYLFGLTCEGSFSLRYWDGELFTMLQNWTPSPAVKTGAGVVNRLGVLAEQSSMRLYANGQLLGTVSDDRLDMGSFGLFVGSVNTLGFQVQISDIAYWDLSEAAP